MPQRRSRHLKPLSSEHHQALLVAFQLKKGLAGHADSAGAPRDLPGLLALARRFVDGVFAAHARAEEELLGPGLPEPDARRLRAEHAELSGLATQVEPARQADARRALTAFAELLERHVRWEERELFPACEERLGEGGLATVGHELEKRLVLSRHDEKKRRG